MRIRTLVPALACLAAAPFATAAEGGPTVKFDGFVDTAFTFVSSDTDVNGTADETNSKFVYDIKLGVTATITEKVTAQIDVVVNGDDGTALIRQAFGAWQINDMVDLKTGKFISDVGFVAAYATGLYRVNAGPIAELYGNDQVGARVGYTKDAISAGLTVANGLFADGEDNNNGQSDGVTTPQGNEKYAYVADVVFTLPEKKGEVNGELAYDTDVTGKGGDGLHFGLNAKLTPSEPITVGAEFIYQSFSAPDGSTVEDQNNMGLLAMVNYKLGAAVSFPASVTGMVQYVSVTDSGWVDPFNIGTGFDASVTELAVALLTNPVGGDKLNLNFELSYSMIGAEPSTGGTEVKTDSVAGAAELLYVF